MRWYFSTARRLVFFRVSWPSQSRRRLRVVRRAGGQFRVAKVGGLASRKITWQIKHMGMLNMPFQKGNKLAKGLDGV
jgi:hypothetical protein